MGNKGPSQKTQDTQNQLTQAQIATQQQQQQQSNQLFGTSFPGFKQAESYYQALASGDPSKTAAAIGPAVGNINTQSQSAVKQIRDNMPRGGAEQVAEGNVEQQRAGQIGNLTTQAYTGAFPALGALSQGGIGLASNEISNAIQAGAAGSQSNAQSASMQTQGKASTMSFLASLVGAGGQIGAAALTPTAA